ncbi:AAA family ATPase [Streptomyces sp. HB132]|uniref:AAA family ATPase n=1 Tax=Streptomyces sp. HB132 TaxID=767388 RepID=UPI00196210BD|nr:AAA family ATPase [Streptomyces sp. HB132]MBM7440530.1 5-methylcytosine-specific restriction protein B [Streptomyces sp. HB132]
MPQLDRLPGTPEFSITLPKDGGAARGHLLTEFGGNGTHKFVLQKGSSVAAEAWPGLGDHARRNRAELRADEALADVPPDPGRPEAARRWVATRDITCNSSSAAAALVYGYDASGPESWRTVEGHPLADYLSTGWRAPRKAWLVRGSNVSGHNLVRQLWLEEGVVSIAGAHLPPLEESDPTKSALRRFVEDGYEGAASYNQKRGLVDELHAFLTQMRVGDTVATIGDGRLHVGRITGDAVQTPSPGGRSNLRRTVTWETGSHPYEELPEEVQQKLSVQHDVVDLTGVLEALDTLEGQTGASAVGAPVQQSASEGQAPRDLSLPDVTGPLAADLLVHDRAWLEEMRELLTDDKQLVFYGPPGTGKTYLAMKLAEYFGGGPEQVKIVQFHPSYSYEDFFEGFRPMEDPETREVAFRLTAGPLRELADLASREGNRHVPHFLIIDEINRANLAKVFGELYFLLEYRTKSVRLTYSGDDFALPPNLFVIGTMNTADRSIALVDAAMRRRFAFVELSPRVEPTAGLLARWLERQGKEQEPAHLLDALNARIDDADFAIGPSYLMKPGVYRDGGLERTWRTKILPLLEEYHYGEGLDVAARYGLASLREQLP